MLDLGGLMVCSKPKIVKEIRFITRTQSAIRIKISCINEIKQASTEKCPHLRFYQLDNISDKFDKRI